MRILSLRLIVALIVGVTMVSLVSSWHQVRTEKNQLRLDLERKSETFTESLAANAESYLRIGDMAGLESIVNRFSNRDHLLGIGVYNTDFHPLAATPNLGAVVSTIPDILKDAIASNSPKTADARVHLKRLYVLAVPLRNLDNRVAGGMIVVYDTGYIRAQTFRVWGLAFLHLAGQVLVIVAITLLIVRWSLVGPIARAGAMDENAARRPARCTSFCERSRFSATVDPRSCASRRKHAPGAGRRRNGSQAPKCESISLDSRTTGRSRPHEAEWQQPLRRLQPRALRP